MPPTFRFPPTPARPSIARQLLLTFGLAFAASSGASAQTPATPPRPTCATPDHRAFDFWLGDWNVTVGGNPAGTNRITLEESGCIVHEHWVGQGGSTGQSFNFYDRHTREWNQVWIDSSGGVLRFTGNVVDGTLRYRSVMPGPNGTTVEHRLLFTPNADGSVRQLWETSTDAGATWTVAFDGLYRKKPA